MKNTINLIALLIVQTLFSQSEIYLTVGSTETNLQNALNDNSIGTIHIRTDIQINSNIIIPSNKVITFSAMNELIINNSGNITFQNTYVEAGKYQIIVGNNFSGKLVNDTVYPEWFGAKIDDNIDDSFAIQKANDLTLNKVEFTKGEYLSMVELNISSNLNLNNAKLRFELDGQEQCLNMKSNSSVKNGSIVNQGINPFGAGNYQCPILVGNYGTGEASQNVVLENLTIESNRPDGNGIMVTGSSNQIKIRNINFPNSHFLGRGILVHWGGASYIDPIDPEKNVNVFTKHPFNITIENVKLGNMGARDASTSAVFISGAYNIKVTNISAEELSFSDGLISVYPGDFGANYAEHKIKNLINRNIIFQNSSVELAHQRVARVNGLQNTFAEGQDFFPGPTIVNIVGNGPDGNDNSGIIVRNSLTTMIKDCSIEGFKNGLMTEGSVTGLIIDGGLYSNNQEHGVSVAGTGNSTRATIQNIEAYHNGQDSTGNFAGIFIGGGTGARIINNNIGRVNETQKWGIRLDNNSSDNILENNHVDYSEISGYSLGSWTTFHVLYKFSGNSASENVGLYQSGVHPLILDTVIGDSNSKIRICSGKGIPINGDWNKGDKIYNNLVNSSSVYGWICTKSGNGTQAEWKTFGSID
jgi:hypothetical protein